MRRELKEKREASGREESRQLPENFPMRRELKAMASFIKKRKSNCQRTSR